MVNTIKIDVIWCRKDRKKQEKEKEKTIGRDDVIVGHKKVLRKSVAIT